MQGCSPHDVKVYVWCTNYNHCKHKQARNVYYITLHYRLALAVRAPPAAAAAIADTLTGLAEAIRGSKSINHK